MFDTLPKTANEFMEWSWSQIEPYYQDLGERPLDSDNLVDWLGDWTQLNELVFERYARLNVAVTVDTTDQAAEAQFNAFIEDIYPPVLAAENNLKSKLLASELETEGFEVPLGKMRAEAQIFQETNLPLLSQERKMVSEFNKVIGAQTVIMGGEEYTLQQLRQFMRTPDRAERERVWRLAAERQLEDRDALNALWRNFVDLRIQLAQNANLPDYRAYRWKQMTRLDYTPSDCLEFQESIEQAVVPAATRTYEKLRTRMEVDDLRPWDLDLDLYPIHQPPLPIYGNVETLAAVTESIFKRVHPQLGEYFSLMRSENLLDLENRKGKAPGAYCTNFPTARRPFIFMNAVGLSEDVRTILHESGHAFHNFERFQLPFAQQRIPGLEFSEVASMAMELLAAPFVSAEEDSLYSKSEAKRFQLAHLERILAFWPYMAVVDAFQNWVYTHSKQARDPANCDDRWLELWDRYLPGVNWRGLEEEAKTGWHRKQHIFRAPFYYVEYGLAQLGAVQVWQKALEDPESALKRYRYALSLGGTRTLPELYQAAGARFAFDTETLGEAVKLVEETIAGLQDSL